MTTFLDKLNLRPQERRLVMGVMVGVIVVLNYLFVWPYFSEWGKVRNQIEQTQRKIRMYQQEIRMDDAPVDGYKAQLAKLEKKGESVQLEGEVQLYNVIMSQARGKVMILNYLPQTTRNAQTNQFYEEQSMVIDVDSTEKELVDFIYGIGGDSSMIRVRELTLAPADANRYRLKGKITLSANYQKKTATNAAPVAPKATTGRPALVPKPAAKPAAVNPGAPKPK